MVELLEHYRELRRKNEHFTESSISTYINFNQDLSEAERIIVQKHLSSCAECEHIFIRVFDEELEFDDAAERQTLQRVVDQNEGNNVWLFSDQLLSVKIEIDPANNDHTTLTLMNFPDHLNGASLRIQVPDSNVIFRIVAVRIGEKYLFPAVKAKLRKSPNHLEIDWLQRNYNYNVEQPQQSPVSIWRWYIAAAAVLITTSIGLFFMLDRPGLLTESATVSQVHNGQAYAPNPVLENFVNRHLRGTAQAKLMTPAVGDTVKVPITFRWKYKADQFQLTIVSNENEILWTANSSKSEITFHGKITPGLYYWKLSSGNTLLGVSKFVVK